MVISNSSSFDWSSVWFSLIICKYPHMCPGWPVRKTAEGSLQLHFPTGIVPQRLSFTHHHSPIQMAIDLLTDRTSTAARV